MQMDSDENEFSEIKPEEPLNEEIILQENTEPAGDIENAETPEEEVSEIEEKPVEDAPQEPVPEKKKSKIPGKNKKPMWIAIISVIVVIMLISSVFGIQIYAQSSLEKTEIDILGMNVISSSANTLELEINVNIIEPTGKTVYYDSLDLDIYSDGSLMGKAAIPSSQLQPGESTMAIAFTIDDENVFDSFLGDFFSQSTVPVNMKGQIRVRSTGVMGATSIALDMNKDIEIPGFTGLDIDVTGLEITSSGNGNCMLNATISVTNPSQLSIDLGNAIFNLSTEFGHLGNGIGYGIALSPGISEFTMFLDTQDADPDVLGSVIFNYLSGIETVVNITGSWETSIPGLIGNVLSTFQASTTISQASTSLNYASLEGKVSIEIDSLDIVDTTNTSILVRSILNIVNDMDMQADIPGFNIDLITSAGSLGNVDIGAQNLSSGSNLVIVETWLTPEASALEFVVLNYLDGVNSTVFIEGGNNAANPLLGDILSSLSLTVDIVTGGAVITDNFNFELTSLNIANQTLGVNMSIDIINPGSFSADLDSLSADLYYDGNMFATVEIGDVAVGSGTNTINREVDVAVQDMATATIIAGRYLMGLDTNITASLESEIGAPCIADALTSNFDIALTVEGLDAGMTLDIQNVALAGTTADGFIFNADVIFTNPTDIEGPVGPMEFDIYDSSNNPIGNLTVPEIIILPGTNTYQILGVMAYIPDSSDIDAIVHELFAGNDVTFNLTASTSNGDMMNYLLNGFTVPVTLTAVGEMSMNILDIRLVSADEANTTFTIAMNVSIHNPTTFDAVLVNGTIDIGNNTPSARESLGIAWVENVFVPAGNSTVEIVGILTPVNLSLTRNIIHDYLTGENVILNLSASMSFRGNGLTRLFYVNNTVDMVLPPCEALDLVVDNIRLVDTTNDTLVMTVDLRVFNPTIVEGNIPSIPFDLIYNGTIIGNFSTGEFYLHNGWNPLNLTVNITTLNQTEMDNFVTAFLNGDYINITARASNSTTMGYLLSGLEFNISLGTGVAIEFDIYEPVLVDTTGNSLLFNVSVGVNNPSTMPVTLNDTFLDVFYRGVDVGNLTIDNQTIASGDNIILTQMNLTSSNTTAIEEILSKYIAGNDVTFQVSGTYKVHADGASQPVNLTLSMDVILPGIDEPIIAGITIDSVTVIINYDTLPVPAVTSVSYDVQATAMLNNPTNVDFNLTWIQYDIYFDDDDGADFMGILSYGPKNNIFVGPIDEDVAPDLHFNPGQSQGYSSTYSGSDIETGIRLDDEHNKGKLDMDLLNGVMSLDIGNFSIDVPFQLLDVHVD